MTFLKEKFTAQELKKVFSGPPKSRLDRIIEACESEVPPRSKTDRR